ncbi:hypothetical protein BT96DRAFT_223849 [Gymnopus androsaceus JB14]|uniref:Zn(2)-C6 fungal-type domain-containing protein n=1 Tax=Gymnopus androsaceus JB14 TaxID=1447944 RepID=A0A6A4ICV9_9AGAR|nr:hypothetical protein BT96DRAFT_223849 [Gymnopus androsaceus JB14]
MLLILGVLRAKWGTYLSLQFELKSDALPSALRSDRTSNRYKYPSFKPLTYVDIMPATTTSRRKSQSPSELEPLTGGNDCKKRRNRAILSCLSCHTSKRMCDRKRPACTRCIELGMTGQCVYEVDEYCQRLSSQDLDQCSSLRKRVAELEGELNRRHSHWPSEFSNFGQYSDDANILNTPLSSFPSSPTPSLDLSTFPMGPSSHVGINDASVDLISILAQSPRSIGYDDNMEMRQQFSSGTAMNTPCHNTIQPCTCVQDASNYQAMLELSLRLRKAIGVLGQYPLHQGVGRYCLLNQTLMELDNLTNGYTLVC